VSFGVCLCVMCRGGSVKRGGENRLSQYVVRRLVIQRIQYEKSLDFILYTGTTLLKRSIYIWTEGRSGEPDLPLKHSLAYSVLRNRRILSGGTVWQFHHHYRP
jgi:hypothetical protein